MNEMFNNVGEVGSGFRVSREIVLSLYANLGSNRFGAIGKVSSEVTSGG